MFNNTGSYTYYNYICRVTILTTTVAQSGIGSLQYVPNNIQREIQN